MTLHIPPLLLSLFVVYVLPILAIYGLVKLGKWMKRKQ